MTTPQTRAPDGPCRDLVVGLAPYRRAHGAPTLLARLAAAVLRHRGPARWP